MMRKRDYIKPEFKATISFTSYEGMTKGIDKLQELENYLKDTNQLEFMEMIQKIKYHVKESQKMMGMMYGD